MQLRKLRQERSAAAGEMNANESPIVCTVLLANQTAPGGTVYQTHHRVVPLLEELSQLADICRAGSMSRDTEQKLVLLGCNACGARSLFAKAQELAQVISELRQAPDEMKVQTRRRLVTRAIVLRC